MIKSIVLRNHKIETITIQNLFASFCCVLQKTLYSFMVFLFAWQAALNFNPVIKKITKIKNFNQTAIFWHF